jgi:hypothetical protein
MGRIVPSAEVEAELMHHLETTYAPHMRMQRYRTQSILLARPPNTTYSAPVTLTCATCGNRIEYQVLSVLAAWLRWGLWVVLTTAGLAALAWGMALAIRTEASGLLLVGLFMMSAFGMFWVTEFGVSGAGTRFTTDPHGLRPHRPRR